MSTKEKDSQSNSDWNFKKLFAITMLSIMGGGGYYEVRGIVKEQLPTSNLTSNLKIAVLESEQKNVKEKVKKIDEKIDKLQEGQTRILELLIRNGN